MQLLILNVPNLYVLMRRCIHQWFRFLLRVDKNPNWKQHWQKCFISSYYRALMKYGPLFTLSFLCIWFRWCHPSIQFVFCLCLYDGFLTMIDLNHLALLADLALSSEDRATLNWYCSVFSGCGSLSVFLSYRFWDRDNMSSFHVFCTILAAFSMIGFLASSLLLKHHFITKKVKVDTPDGEKRWEILFRF